MKKNTKILLGLVALGGVIYLMRKPKATSTEPATEEETGTGGGGFGGGGIGGGYGMPVISNRSNVPSAPALETATPSNLQSATTSSARTAQEGESKSTQADAENMINWGIAPIRRFVVNRYPTANIEVVNKATSEVANFQRANKSMKGVEANTQIIALIDRIVKPVIAASNAMSGGNRSGVGTLDLSSLPRGL
jgi:hypothetical protein